MSQENREGCDDVFCDFCERAIDPTICWCGDDQRAHTMGDGHPFIPMGCECGRSKPKTETLQDVFRRKLRGPVET